ncbi:MAG: hypothetical protein H0U67_10690 [Gemmatimonadetes bacterium]|nr:hypothetical protein [Gemmatimonadota bacterium]
MVPAQEIRLVCGSALSACFGGGCFGASLMHLERCQYRGCDFVLDREDGVGGAIEYL